MMHMLIVTPSYNQLEFLKRCVASVADQTTVDIVVHHHVQDGASNDGSAEWLEEQTGQCDVTPNYTLTYESKRDEGMYDAINRGFRTGLKAIAEKNNSILAHLNCDEQYLPGALEKVAKYFIKYSGQEVAYAHTLVVNPEGKLICYRKAVRPSLAHTWVCFTAPFTAATFYRTSVMTEHNLFFNTKWRDLGDADWNLRRIRNKIPCGILNEYTSAFVDTGQNMNLQENARIEGVKLFFSAPGWMKRLAPVWSAHYRLKKLCSGAYFRSTFEYQLYWGGTSRKAFRSVKASGQWTSRRIPRERNR